MKVHIKTTNGKIVHMFISQNIGRWTVTGASLIKGVVHKYNVSDTNPNDAYLKAAIWVINNIDDKAVIDPLWLVLKCSSSDLI